MTDYIAFTRFVDLAQTQVRDTAEAHGDKARSLLDAFHRLKGWEPREGDIISGCRIDRIGSEEPQAQVDDRARRANELFEQGDQKSAVLVLRGEAS